MNQPFTPPLDCKIVVVLVRRERSPFDAREPASASARKWWQELKRQARCEAVSLLARYGYDYTIWSHGFRHEGENYLLSTSTRPARKVTVRGIGHRERTVLRPPRILVEVEKAPQGLTLRTVLRPPQKNRD